jgi:uncharacterized membrane protein
MTALRRLLHPLRGSRGHPSHPPTTDAAIGMFTLGTGLLVIGALGGLGDAAGKAAWLALLGGIIAAVPAALTGLADWLSMTPGTPVAKTATWHLGVMVTAVILFVLSAIFQYPGYRDGEVETAALVLGLVAFLALAAGGWLGGTIVFVHGQRVMSQPLRPTSEAIRPEPGPYREERPV